MPQRLYEEVILFISLTVKKSQTSIQAHSSSSRSLRTQKHFKNDEHKPWKYLDIPSCFFLLHVLRDADVLRQVTYRIK